MLGGNGSSTPALIRCCAQRHNLLTVHLASRTRVVKAKNPPLLLPATIVFYWEHTIPPEHVVPLNTHTRHTHTPALVSLLTQRRPIKCLTVSSLITDCSQVAVMTSADCSYGGNRHRRAVRDGSREHDSGWEDARR